jgi:hypothetical protein
MTTLEQIQDNIPKYLTSEQQAELVAQLNKFETKNYYSILFQQEMLQGDGWTSIEVVKFENGQRDKIKGILLSNSCDIDPSNRRDFPPRIVFAPLVKMTSYIDALRKKSNIKSEQIDLKVDAIRKQHVTSLFFLPKGAALDDDYIAVLDDLHTVLKSDEFSFVFLRRLRFGDGRRPIAV